jgi:hypothetical protein
MTAYRPFGTDPASAAWESQVSTAALDITQLHTERLDPPASLEPLLPPDVVSSPPPPPAFPPAPPSPPPLHSAQFAHPPLPLPLVPPPGERDPRAAAIAEHLRAARLQHENAELVLDALKQCSAEANLASQRWFTLMHAGRRAPEQAAAYARLEEQVLALSRQMAHLRLRHSAYVEQAREHEDAARRMQSGQSASDPPR